MTGGVHFAQRLVEGCLAEKARLDQGGASLRDRPLEDSPVLAVCHHALNGVDIPEMKSSLPDELDEAPAEVPIRTDARAQRRQEHCELPERGVWLAAGGGDFAVLIGEYALSVRSLLISRKAPTGSGKWMSRSRP